MAFVSTQPRLSFCPLAYIYIYFFFSYDKQNHQTFKIDLLDMQQNNPHPLARMNNPAASPFKTVNSNSMCP
ncbi:hypothetical protein EUGRSUZ_J01138 [Eucalyptus grandis]|uniref:Uncharacterized protein n=2 Tax=Eucalyptus grandis TaxID=71139 RepID=A0ACC3J6A1_EUCGR|nr:hypothetical protein EUGRSUZ_J01138 [Eucalyptus grandis]